MVIKNWDWVFLAIYAAALLVLELPKLGLGYDRAHDASLLMTSIRIWAGQVPYRDFYPWYGPLYHYLLALFAGPLGNNLYAVKFYIKVINPVLCVAILIFSLRRLELNSAARLYILAAAVILGLERIFYCGSLRAFLPVLALALGFHAFTRGHKFFGFMLFPFGWLLCLFSIEAGLLTIVGLALMTVLSFRLAEDRPDRRQVRFWSVTGLIAVAVLTLILLMTTSWLPGYLKYLSLYLQDFNWAYGTSNPGLQQLRADPSKLFFYLPPLVCLAAAIIHVPAVLRKGQGSASAVWIISLAGFGLLLWISRHQRGIYQFLYLPAVILAGLLFIPRPRPARVAQAIAIVLLIPGAIYFRVSSAPPRDISDYRVLGVRVPESWKNNFETIGAFARGHADGAIAFPAQSIYYAFLGRVPDLPFDDFFGDDNPELTRIHISALERLAPAYLILNMEELFSDYPYQTLDPLFDFIDSNYERIQESGPVWIYRKRPRPAALFDLTNDPERNLVLDRNNNFKIRLKLPKGAEFVEIYARFHYASGLCQKFSLPLVECRFDGRNWLFPMPEARTERIKNTPGMLPYRIYFLYDLGFVDFKIGFPGAFNCQPESVVVEKIVWGKMKDSILITPRTIPYELEKP